jgi:hypothetical protein
MSTCSFCGKGLDFFPVSVVARSPNQPEIVVVRLQFCDLTCHHNYFQIQNVKTNIIPGTKKMQKT